MEILYASLLGFFLLAIYFFYNHKSGGNANLRPPGKTGFPVIGETLEFLSAWWKGHPEKFIVDRIAKSSHVFKTSLFGSQVIVFCGSNGHRFLFSNENKLVQAWSPSSIDKIFQHSTKKSTSKEALRLKQMFPNLLKPMALQGYLGLIDTVAHRHFVTDWEKKDTVVAFPLAYHYTFLLGCSLFVSLEDPKHIAILEKPFGVLAAGILSLPIDFPGTAFNRAIKASNLIRKELLVIIKQRKIDLAEGKASPTQDILSRMLSTSDDNGKFMHEADVADQILGMIVAGHDTTSSVCTSIVKYLAELPEIYQVVYQEQVEIAKSKAPGELLNWYDIQKMKYSWNVACEVMRLAPPNIGTFREAIADFTYDGFSIQKGSKLYWNPNSTHRNHEFFPEPQKFDPSRFEGSGPAPYTFLPFGGGPRICPGKEFARLQILVFMHHLVKRFRWEKLIPDEKVFYIPLPSSEKGLPIRLFPH